MLWHSAVHSVKNWPEKDPGTLPVNETEALKRGLFLSAAQAVMQIHDHLFLSSGAFFRHRH